MNGTITWNEINGIGTLTLVWDSGERKTIKHDQPINAGTDSGAIARLFCGWTAFDMVEHDQDSIHVSRNHRAITKENRK